MYQNISYNDGITDLNFEQANRYLDDMADVILTETQMTAPNLRAKKGDRQWNDTRRQRYDPENDPRPKLKAVVLDFSAVNNLDVTTVQALVDVRAQLDRHTAPYKATWYFASVKSPWAKRALSSADFDGELQDGESGLSRVGLLVSKLDTAGDAAKPASGLGDAEDLEANAREKTFDNQTKASGTRRGMITGLNSTSFYPDVQSACERAIDNAQKT